MYFIFMFCISEIVRTGVLALVTRTLGNSFSCGFGKKGHMFVTLFGEGVKLLR